MLPLVLLLACNLSTPVHQGGESVEVDVVEAPPATGELRIATHKDPAPSRAAPVLPSDLPAGEPIVRACFGARDPRLPGGATRAVDTGAREGGGAGSGPAGSTGRARPSPKPSASPPPPPAKRQRAPLLDAIRGGLGAEEAASADASAPMAVAPPPASPPMPEAEPAPAEDRAPAADEAARRPPESQKKDASDAPKGAADDDGSAPREMKTRTEADRGDTRSLKQEVVEEEVPAEPQVVLDWGATVYLSNDDSMSLASAQRMLYALKAGRRLSPSEVRPHELLNYFSFDVAPVPDGQTFSVLGAAEQDGDVLSVSLAVRGANPARQPLDLSLVVDRSGSMSAEGRMEYTKRGLTTMVDQLQRGDRIDIVLFDTGVCTPLEGFVVGRDDLSLLQQTIALVQPTSSTNLDAGLREAWRIHDGRTEPEGQRNKRVVLVTDAQLNAGLVNEALVSEVGRRYDEQNIRLTGVGVGRDFNDKLLDQLTEKGKGAYVYLGSEAVVDRVFGPGFDSLTRTIAHDVQFSLELPPSLAMKRFYGEEASTNAADVQPIHYYAGTTQLFLQDLAVRDGRVVSTDPVRMRIRYRDAISGEPAEEVLHTTVGALLDGDRHNLHKGQALMAFSDVVMASAMGAAPCGEPLAAYRQKVASLVDDAEIGYTNGLVGQLCRVDMAVEVPAGVAYKVRVDADSPIAEVELACSGQRKTSRLSGGDTVARFASVTPGACTVSLQGTVPMTAAVEVPETGGDVRCVVRGGRLSCS